MILSFSAANSKAMEPPITPPPMMATSNALTHSYYQQFLSREDRLEGLHEFDGEQAGFLRQILRAGEIAGLDGFTRLLNEPADFFFQIILRRASLSAAGELEILFGDTDVLIGLAFVVGLFFRR
jgi:hypothetical protein